MHLIYGPYIWLPLIALLVALLMMIRVWRHRSTPIAITFLILMSALALWSLAVVLEHASPGLNAKIFWVKMSYLGIVTLPATWLVFALQYANKERWLTKRYLAFIAILPAVTLVAVWTNDIYHLMWKDIWLDINFSPPVDAVTHNIWFWVQAAYSYLLIFLGNLTLLRVFLRSSGIYRKQVGIMLLATIIPWVANFAFIMGIGPFSVVDPTPLAFAITGAAFLWGLSRFQLLEIMPIAQEAIFKNMVDGVIVLDGLNRVIDLNPSAQHIIGHSRAELVGKPYRIFLPELDGQLDIKPGTRNTPAIIAIGKSQTQHYYGVSISPIFTKQQLSGYLVLLHDETERVKAEGEARERIRLETELIERKRSEQTLRASEAKFRNLVENAASGILVNLPEGPVLSANKAGLKIFGFDSEDEIKKTTVIERYANPRDREPLLRLMDKTGVARGFEVRLKRRDGVEFWASLNVITQIAESGEKQFISIIEDITERKQAAAELFRLNKELKLLNSQLEAKVEERTKQLEAAVSNAEAANRAKSDFLASMSHELRTPLNAVIGFSQMLQEQYFGPLNEKQTEYVVDIADSGKHLLSLINDVLDISKIEAGKMELEISSVKIADIIRNSLVMVKEKALAHNINLEVRIGEDAEALEITGDERRLKQVMFNLLSNATKFTPDGGTIRVETKREDHELAISVSDNGIGVTGDEKKKLFRAFYQASGGIKNKTPGTGLGLAITRSIVEKHGGRIWLESEGRGKGSRFIFTLPVGDLIKSGRS